MPTPTYTPIATITLASTDSEIVFSSIPATYRDLIVVMRAGTSANSNNIMRFNGDTGTNYSGVYATGNGSTATSGTYDSSFIGTDSSAFTTTTVGDTNQVIQIQDYSATDKHKTVLIRANRAGGVVDMIAARWANTSAITTISLKPNNGSYNWLSGSSFSLYGIVS